MSKPEISDEAVEAACVAQYERERGRDTWVAYEEMPQEFIDRYRTQALLILEAAAPHMLADVWQAAYWQGVDDAETSRSVGGPDEWPPNRINPYRSQE